MTLDDLATSLPNGLHDAELHSCTINYATRSVQLVLKIWIGGPENVEVYRPANINLTGLQFWIIEPPDPNYSGDDTYLVIDIGSISASAQTSRFPLPNTQETSFLNWIYVRQWNSFIYLAAEAADLRWTGPEEINTDRLNRSIFD